MKLPAYFTLATLGLLCVTRSSANEALDVLEGKKRAIDVTLPDLATSLTGTVDTLSFKNEWKENRLDPTWSRAVLFADPTNPWIQQLAITGLFQGNAVLGSADATPSPTVNLDSVRTRRARLGARIKAFNNTDIEAIGEFTGDSPNRGIERLQARTQLPKDYYVSYGKMRPTFTTEYSTEAQRAKIAENSFLVNMLSPASTLGVVVGKDTNDWDWSLGWFSSDLDGQIPKLQGNGSIAASIAHESTNTSADGKSSRTRWHADYINNMDRKNSETIPRYNLTGRLSANGNQVIANPAYRHLFSSGVQLVQGKFGFAGDFMIAHGDTAAWGFSITPTYWAIPSRLQLVGRYHFAGTDEAGGLVGGLGNQADPFFDRGPVFVGNEVHSFYLGANVHLYKDEIVLMNGVERVELDDQTGGGFDADAWIFHTGARLSF